MSSHFIPNKTKLDISMREKAFTLVEILVGIVIFAIVVIGIMQVMMNCVLLNKAQRNESRAGAHAQYILENIRNTYFPTVNATIAAGGWDWTVANLTAEGLEALESEVITTDAEWFNATTNEMLNITITVDWNEQGRARNISLSTQMSEI